MTFEAHTENYHGLTIRVEADNFADDPLEEWDTLGTMVTSHPRYKLGHEQASVEEINEIANDPKNIVLPLYLYDHSGLSISTDSFSCRWDSGCVGIVYVSKAKVRSEWQKKRISSELRRTVLANLNGMVKTYNHYLTGNVWRYEVLDEAGDVLDACSGFYGDWETSGCLDDARMSARWTINTRVQKHVVKLKQWIKGKISIQYRTACPVTGGTL